MPSVCDRCLPTPPRRDVLRAALALPFLTGLSFEPPSAAPGRALRAAAPDLEIHPRADWAGSDRPPKGTIVAEEVRFLLVHHTAGSNSYDAASVPGQIRGMYDFHTGAEKGWPDVAYNFLIDRFGGVWEARAGSLDGPVSGDATGGNQGFSQLVSLMGDFSSQEPTPEALSSLRATLGWLADRSGLDTSPGIQVTFESKGSNRHSVGAQVKTPTINGHRSMSQTSCPGEALFGYVQGGLTADVDALRSGGPAPTTTTTTTSNTETTTTTESTTTESSLPESTPEPPTTSTTEAVGSSSSSVPVSSRPQSPSTVDQVASPLPSDPPAPGSAESLSAWEGLGLAGIAGIAAIGGLISLRTRRNS